MEQAGQPEAAPSLALFRCLLAKDTDGATQLLNNAPPGSLALQGPQGFTALHAAVGACAAGLLPTLAAAGAPLNMPMQLWGYGQQDLRGFLRSCGLDDVLYEQFGCLHKGMTPLGFAAAQAAQDGGACALALLGLGVDVNAGCPLPLAALLEHHNIAHGDANLALAAELLRRGADCLAPIGGPYKTYHVDQRGRAAQTALQCVQLLQAAGYTPTVYVNVQTWQTHGALSRLRDLPPVLGELDPFDEALPLFPDWIKQTRKERNEELDKPASERDEARLLELTKRVLRLRAESAQAWAQALRRNIDIVLQQPDLGCCSDCLRVRLRVVASLRANAAWHEQWAQISTLRLQAWEQGQPAPPLTLPYLDVQPHLAEGVPLDLPPSIDRCAACQDKLEKHLYNEHVLLAQVDYDP
ncbi:DNA helicase exodeoxyribonuclease subunit A [Chlorella sorokiniana]|uniref:DNA helicase exodeoxyribonuclease subunit A n=1 Tax=Chlorella sorokiniana TaxID=3076 RepID=A0A2P6TKT9_CHLSO|nr:DNA helicase exodeoxyribonuclease subunit A [Chlorella sorokiniana]|eukprot:PRW44894.1 DNA helicase exodeoxyribonuclease subunit A [Chlorella sorokiniana]